MTYTWYLLASPLSDGMERPEVSRQCEWLLSEWVSVRWMCLVSWGTVVTKRQSLKLRLLSRHQRISDEKVSIGRFQFEFEAWKVFEYPLVEPSWLWLWLSLAPAGNSFDFDFVLWWITAVGQRTTNNEKWSTNNKQLHTLSCAWPFKSDTIFCDLLWLASNLWLTVTNVATNPINRSTINGQCDNDNDNDNESNESNNNNVWAYRKRGYRYKCRYIDAEQDTYNANCIYRYANGNGNADKDTNAESSRFKYTESKYKFGHKVAYITHR